MLKFLEPTHSNQTHKQWMYKPDNIEPMYSHLYFPGEYISSVYYQGSLPLLLPWCEHSTKMLESCSVNLEMSEFKG